MKAEPLGDSALILRELSRPAYEVAAAIQLASIPGVIEAVASYETVGIYFDPDKFDIKALLAFKPEGHSQSGKAHVVPVYYELGEDLGEVAGATGLSTEEVIRLHTSVSYMCYAVGFCPGFPYLGYLPEALASIPRRPSPRVRIHPGSVAIAGRQTGIYPIERPGGWSILGRTPLCIADVESAYFPIAAGDEVQFRAIDRAEYDDLVGNRL